LGERKGGGALWGGEHVCGMAPDEHAVVGSSDLLVWVRSAAVGMPSHKMTARPPHTKHTPYLPPPLASVRCTPWFSVAGDAAPLGAPSGSISRQHARQPCDRFECTQTFSCALALTLVNVTPAGSLPPPPPPLTKYMTPPTMSTAPSKLPMTAPAIAPPSIEPSWM